MLRLGLDIGGTSVKSAIVAADGRLVATARSDEYARPSIDALVRAVSSAVPSDAAIDAVGLCVPGLLNADKSRVEYAANLPALQELPLAELVTRALQARGLSAPKPPRVHSDAAAAAYAFWHRYRFQDRLLAISLGTGVGAAVIDNGRFLKVTGESCGHLGQIDVSLDADAPLGPDHGRGGLEAYLGAPALRRDLGDNFPPLLAALDVRSSQIRALARALRICHAIYRPQHIALLGFVGLSLASAEDAIRQAVDTDLTRVARSGWQLHFGDSPHLAAKGAALLANI